MNEPRSHPIWTRPLFLCVFMLAALLIFFWRELGAWDLWLHIKSGELILRECVVHDTDPYSFRALGRP